MLFVFIFSSLFKPDPVQGS